MNNKIEMYHYGDCGKYDNYNPIKLIDEKYVSEILYHIGKSEPYTLGINEMHYIIGKDVDIIKSKTKKMLELDMIKERDNLYSINFTMIF